jgi:hypothetical protein
MCRFLTAMMAFICIVPAAHAKEFPPVYVVAEIMPNEATSCGYSHDSIAATVKSELRHNRIEIATMEDYPLNAILGFIITNADYRADFGLCAVRFDFSFWTMESITLSPTKEKRVEQVVFCERGGLITGKAKDVQKELNNNFRDYTSQCIFEYLGE